MFPAFSSENVFLQSSSPLRGEEFKDEGDAEVAVHSSIFIPHCASNSGVVLFLATAAKIRYSYFKRQTPQ
jgi:hypothetical protein